jgi:hypothetical protein
VLRVISDVTLHASASEGGLMRATLVTILLFGPIASAAPVPADSKAERATLESLWKDLESVDAVVRLRAVFALVDHPKATDFLSEKLPAVKASEKQIRDWLTELSSDDEAVRNQSVERLKYFDPRLAVGVKEQFKLITTGSGQRALLTVLSGSDSVLGVLGDDCTFSIHDSDPTDITVTCVLEVRLSDGSLRLTKPIDELGHAEPPAWEMAAKATAILDAINTPSANAVLDRLAAGHPKALPTRIATRRYQHGPPAPLTATRFDGMWNGLADHYGYEPVLNARTLMTDPTTIGFLKAKLQPIKSDKAQIKKWIKALDSEREDEWKPAYESLRYYHPILALTPTEIIKLADTATIRTRLHGAWYGSPVNELGMENIEEISLGQSTVTWTSLDRLGNRIPSWDFVPTLSTFRLATWERARIAIILLERIGTPDAKAVLKQLADGHPDILPTKEAKVAIARMK